MMKSDNYDMFVAWCRNLYDSNCKERREHGQEPYEHFEDYYHLHLDWLEKNTTMKKPELNFKHLKEANEGYFEHMSVASWYAIRLGCLALRIAIHAIIPFIWFNTMDSTLRKLAQDKNDRACLRSRYLN